MLLFCHQSPPCRKREWKREKWVGVVGGKLLGPLVKNIASRLHLAPETVWWGDKWVSYPIFLFIHLNRQKHILLTSSHSFISFRVRASHSLKVREKAVLWRSLPCHAETLYCVNYLKEIQIFFLIIQIKYFWDYFNFFSMKYQIPYK